MSKECLLQATKDEMLKLIEEDEKLAGLIEMVPNCKERKKSEYQIFISKCMTEHKSEYKGKPFGAAGPVMKKCAAEWKSRKK